MLASNDVTDSGLRPEHGTAALTGAFIVYILIVGLEGTGRHFLELGLIRLVLFASLLVFARWSGALERRLGKVALALNGASALAYVGGAVGAVATDGWSYDVFGATASTEPPWYAFVLGLSGLVFAVSTLLVGISGRSAGRLAAAPIIAGLSFPLVFGLDDTLGHAAWLSPWLALAIGLVLARSGDVGSTAPMRAVTD